MNAWYTRFYMLHRLPKGHSCFFFYSYKALSGPSLFLFNSSSNFLLWLFKILIFTVFLLKILLNGLFLLKCLSRRFRKYFPMLMLVSLKNGRLNQITFLFLFLPRLFEWILLVSPTLRSPWIPLPLLLPMVTFCLLRVRVHWVYVPQSNLESTIFEGFIIYLFVLSFFFLIWG